MLILKENKQNSFSIDSKDSALNKNLNETFNLI